MKILVTGASGFIGGYVVKELAKNPLFKIVATGRSQSSAFDGLSQVTYLQADLASNFPEMHCDVCIHCAGLANDNSTPSELEQNNVIATSNLLLGLKDCKIFILISSSSVYDFSDQGVKQESDASLDTRISPYGGSKLRAEHLVQKASIPSIYILRPRAVYGKGDRVLLPRILKLVKQKRIITPGSLNIATSLTHVQNLYEAIEKSISQAVEGIHIYNIADNRTYRLNEVIGEIAFRKFAHRNFTVIPIWFIKTIMSIQSLFKSKSRITKQSLDYLTKDSVMSIEKAKTELNYTGKIHFFDRIDELDIHP